MHTSVDHQHKHNYNVFSNEKTGITLGLVDLVLLETFFQVVEKVPRSLLESMQSFVELEYKFGIRIIGIRVLKATWLVDVNCFWQVSMDKSCHYVGLS